MTLIAIWIAALVALPPEVWLCRIRRLPLFRDFQLLNLGLVQLLYGITGSVVYSKGFTAGSCDLGLWILSSSVVNLVALVR